MPPSIPPQPKVQVSPRQWLEFNNIGTGKHFNLDAYQDFVLKHGVEVAREIRRRVQELTGFTPSELQKIATELPSGESKAATKTRNKIRAQMLKTTKRKIEDIRRLSDEADEFIRSCIENFMPGEEEAQLLDEVATCDDPAVLVLRAFNDNLNPKIKYQASRKLLLSKLIGIISDHSEKRVDHQSALGFMTDFYSRRIIKLPEGVEEGTTFDKYLISHHEGPDHRTTKAEMVDTIPEGLDPKTTRVTLMKCRRTILTDKAGHEREALFRKHPRKKSVFSKLIKDLRYGTLPGEKHVDNNGIRETFKNREDFEDFFRMHKEQLEQEIVEGLNEELKGETDRRKREIIEAKLDMPQSGIVITDEKDSMNGEPFDGNCDSSSPELMVYKFKLFLTLGDGRQFQYEFQMFTPVGYADAMFREGVCWNQFHVDRFYKEKLDELIFAAKVHKIDFKKHYEKAMKRALITAWNGNGEESDSPKEQKYEEHWEDTDEGED